MKKAVVTGGAGFIGSHIARELVARGYETHVIDNLSGGKRERVPAGATLHEVDILDTAHATEIMQGADAVFHLAALPRVPFSIDFPQESNRANVDGTVSVLTASRDAGARRVVYAASSSAYGTQPVLPYTEDMQPSPMNPYGLQKYVGELYATVFSAVYGMETVSLRYFNVYGPNMDPEGGYALAIPKFLAQAKAGTPLTITADGKQTRDFTHVRDVVRANMLAMESKNVGKGEAINIGAGRNVSVNELAELIAPGEKREYIPARAEAHDTLAGIKKAKELLGWEPEVKLEDGVSELVREWGIR